MYRIKFVKLSGNRGRRIVEHGPWQPSMQTVEAWIDYFSSINYSVNLEIEHLVQGRPMHLRTVRLQAG